MTFIYCKTQRYLHKLYEDVAKAKRSKGLKRLLITSGLALLTVMLVMAITFSTIGAISTVEASDIQAFASNFTNISNSVGQDAGILAKQMCGDGQEAAVYNEQLLTAYSESIGKDIVILFNPGGWGTKKVQDSVGWTSIINGMRNALDRAGYRVITLNYQRTPDNLLGQLNELKEMITGYDNKAKYLAQLVEFLTNHIAGLTIIVAGESTGTIICDKTMELLKDDNQVYSIQTGSPFWNKEVPESRTLLVNDNGVIPDAFSQGDLATILKYSLLSVVQSKRADNRGEILGFLSAPGHEYQWQYPGVYSKIEGFLSNKFKLVPESRLVISN